MIHLSELSFSYNPDRSVLRSINLSVGFGERVGLIGPNGCGKTTLVQILVGLLAPSGGKIEIMGKPRCREKDFHEVRQHIGMMFQDADDQLFCPTVAEDVAFGPMNIGKTRDEVNVIVTQTLDMLDLSKYKDRITYKLSMGEKRLVALATVLAMCPDFLILDEPTANLDNRAKHHLMEVLSGRDEGLLLVSQQLPVIRELCSRVILMNDGSIIADGPAGDILDDEELLASYGMA